MTKQTILDRLLIEKKITLEELEILKNNDDNVFTPVLPFIPQPVNIPLIPIDNGHNTWIQQQLERSALIAENCACNPKNGGSGMCGCTLANPVIY